MSEENKVVYIGFNNWMSKDSPSDILVFQNLNKFLVDDYCKQNKLCVNYGTIDMSTGFALTAPIEWVNEYCPNIFDEKYKDFVFPPGEDGGTPDEYANDEIPFPHYGEPYGAKYYETHWWDSDDEESEEE